MVGPVCESGDFLAKDRALPPLGRGALEAATREATMWMRGNSCPDREVGGRVRLMLSTCAEVAATAERALSDDCTDIEAVFGRLGDLLAIIDFHSETLKAW